MVATDDVQAVEMVPWEGEKIPKFTPKNRTDFGTTDRTTQYAHNYL